MKELLNQLNPAVVLRCRLTHTHTLTHSSSGVLFYGPPGCGKTLIAKAAAKASGCHFINLQASTLTDKWYGESEKLTAAVFSLAVKLQPCIIFIDEIGEWLVGSEC